MATDIIAYIVGGIAAYFYFKNKKTTDPPPPHSCQVDFHWDDALQMCVSDTPPPPQELTVTFRAYGLTSMNPVPFLEGIPMTLAGSTKPTVAIFNITSGTAYTFSVADNAEWLFDHWDLPIGSTGNPTSRSQSIASSNTSILSYNARMKPVPITLQDSISIRAYNMDASQFITGIQVAIRPNPGAAATSVTPWLNYPLNHTTPYIIDVADNALWVFDHWDFTDPARIPTNRIQPINVPRNPGPLSFNVRFRPR